MKLFDKVMIAAGVSIIGYWCWNTLKKALSKTNEIAELRAQLDDVCVEIGQRQQAGADKEELHALNEKLLQISYELAKVLPGSEDRKIDRLASILFASQKKGFMTVQAGKYSKLVDMMLAAASKMLAVKAVRKVSANVSD